MENNFSLDCQRLCYFGHKRAILDVTISCVADPPVIVTTSDDLTIRLWNPLPSSPNAIKCYCGFGQESVDSLLFHPNQSHLFLGATTSSIIQFDLNSPGIITREHVTLFTLTSSSSTETNEIACFTLHPTDSNLLVISDDDGVIYLFRLESQSITKRLARVHSNLLGKLSFNPMNPSILISGGFDSICCAWDIRRGRPCSNILNFTTINQSNDTNLQIANPPFVHDLLHILHGRILVCALGDGNLALFKSSDGSLLSVSHTTEAHSGMVTNLSSYPKQPTSELEKSDYFISAGADGLIKIWEVREVLTDDLPLHGGGGGGGGKRHKKKSKGHGANVKSEKKKEWYEIIERRAIFHPNKINSISSVTVNGSGSGGGDVPMATSSSDPAIVVCDVTSEWFLYRH
jgi:WD40 repeat protein